MGGHPYWYFVPYEPNLQSALDALRTREFEAGRYNPVLPFIKFREPAFSEQKPGKGHKTIRKAIAASAEDGTRSILDIAKVGKASDYGTAGPLNVDRIRELYGTDKPTRAAIEGDMGFLADIDRGKCIYLIAYDKNGKPAELCFAGYSYD
jgi:hypothetical protein